MPDEPLPRRLAAILAADPVLPRKTAQRQAETTKLKRTIALGGQRVDQRTIGGRTELKSDSNLVDIPTTGLQS